MKFSDSVSRQDLLHLLAVEVGDSLRHLREFLNQYRHLILHSNLVPWLGSMVPRPIDRIRL